MPSQAQVPRTLPEIERSLDSIQSRIVSQERWLWDFAEIYRDLDRIGAAVEGRPMHFPEGMGELLGERWARYQAAKILTMPHPYRASGILPERSFIPRDYEYVGLHVESSYELSRAYSDLSDQAPGVLAEIRRLDEERLQLEAERAFLFQTSEPLTVGPGRGAPGGFRRPNADSLVAEGMRFLTQEDYMAARDRFEGALELDQAHAEAFFGRGLVSLSEFGALFPEESLRSALPDFDRAYSLDPSHFRALFMRGSVRMQLGDRQGAIQDYQGSCDGSLAQGCQELRNLAENLEMQGVQYLDAGAIQEARQFFDQAIQVDPRFPDSYFDRGLIWDHLGNHARAIEDFDQYLLHTRNAEAYFRARSIPLPGTDPAGVAEATLRGGVAALNLGQAAEAAIRLDRAVALARRAAPRDLARYLHFAGMAYEAMGGRARARQRYDEACRLQDQDACTKRDRIGGGNHD